jgi:hypothetical protein
MPLVYGANRRVSSSFIIGFVGEHATASTIGISLVIVLVLEAFDYENEDKEEPRGKLFLENEGLFRQPVGWLIYGRKTSQAG